MNCGLVFYAARKTSHCERALKKSFSELDLKLEKTVFATEPEQLGERLERAFEKLDFVFTVGGLGFEKDSTQDLIARALSKTEVSDLKRLKCSGEDGYLIRAGGQTLILLPDEPELIEEIMQGPLGRCIAAETARK